MAPRVLPVDRLHFVALALTIVASIIMYTGAFLPHFFVLEYRQETVAAYSLFGNVRCSDVVCYPPASDVPEPEPTGTPVTTASPDSTLTEITEFLGLGGDNAAWLMAGRVLCIISCFLITFPILLQVAFFKLNYRIIQIVVSCLLIGAGAFSFIVGFLFINKYATLTRTYVEVRPEGALTYTPAAAGCILITSLLSVVAMVFTAFAFFPPDPDKRFA